MIKLMRDGVDSDFWKALVEAIDENIEDLTRLHLEDQKDFADYSAEECKVRVLVYNEKKQYLDDLKSLPRLIANSFGEPEPIDESMDVY